MAAIRALIHITLVVALTRHASTSFLGDFSKARLEQLIQNYINSDPTTTPEPATEPSTTPELATEPSTTPEPVRPVMRIELSVIEVLKLLEQSNGDTVTLDVLPPFITSGQFEMRGKDGATSGGALTETSLAMGKNDAAVDVSQRWNSDRAERYSRGSHRFASDYKRAESDDNSKRQLKRLVNLLREATSQHDRR